MRRRKKTRRWRMRDRKSLGEDCGGGGGGGKEGTLEGLLVSRLSLDSIFQNAAERKKMGNVMSGFSA